MTERGVGHCNFCKDLIKKLENDFDNGITK